MGTCKAEKLMGRKNEFAISKIISKQKGKKKSIDINLLPGCRLLIATQRNPVSLRKVEYWGDAWKPREQCHWASSLIGTRDSNTLKMVSSLHPPPL